MRSAVHLNAPSQPATVAEWFPRQKMSSPNAFGNDRLEHLFDQFKHQMRCVASQFLTPKSGAKNFLTTRADP